MSIFDSIAVRRKPESVFDLSHQVNLSANMGELIPILLEEILPGDTFRCQSQVLMRLAPMLAPVMHKVNVYVHYFFVPNRLVWDNWNDHITGGEKGDKNPAHPQVNMADVIKSQFAKGTLADYLGLPVIDQGSTYQASQTVSALPFRGYQLIYDEFYRDQDLIPSLEISKGDGQVDPAEQQKLTTLRKRAWARDYFTACRPDSQKGASVLMPGQTVNYSPIARAIRTDGNDASGAISATTGNLQDPTTQVRIENIDSISAATVEDVRVANRLQEWLELAQRGGSRINEVIRNFFDVTPDDLRLQRPQYLGGGVQPIVMSEVLNTASDTDPSQQGALQPLGEYGGHGISLGRSNQFTRRFKEHGYVHAIMSVLPKTSYQQGIHRHWRKYDKFEKYWPQFANVGEQEVQNREIFNSNDQTTANREATFGYIPKYSEYKFACDRVAGEMRQTGTDSANLNLSFWHMARYFANVPTLNEEFISADPSQNIFANTDKQVDKLYIQIKHKVKAKRKMPYHSIPSNMPVV